ncbi:head-tail connector protein [Vibrio mytili]|uniref:head-tail connector protein n=1 Tax=Vibrio mytili TaxID=50718 RepID=UPI002F3FFF2A
MRTLLDTPDAYVPIPEILTHLRLEAVEADELAYVTTLMGAAILTLAADINRDIYPASKAGSIDKTQYPDAIPFDSALKVAVFLLVATWYENRESVAVAVSVNELPLAYHALMRPYRIHMSGLI